MSLPDSSPPIVEGSGRNQTAAGTRRYRSKAQRPCDLCRTRKVLCNIPDPTKPCQLCDRTGRPCTFLVGTRSRPMRFAGQNRPSATPAGFNVADQAGYVAAAAFTENNLLESPGSFTSSFSQIIGNNISTDMEAQWSPGLGHDVLAQPPPFDGLEDAGMPNFWSPQYRGSPLPDLDTTDVHSHAEHHGRSPLNGQHATLTNRADRSSSFIGYSNESDPFLLEHYPHDPSDELDFFMVTYRRPSLQDVSAGFAPIHFLQSKVEAATQSQEVMSKCLALTDERKLLDELVSHDMGVALLRLFQRFIFQNLPIISRTELLTDEKEFIRTTSPGVLAGMFALALPFTSWDEQLCLDNAYSKPDASKLWQISYSCLQKQMHFPSLAAVQLCLLLLNTTTYDPVAVESPFAWSLACSALGIAQSLGLHVDPGNWKIPPGEARLRRRLWWTTVVEHSWRAVTHGRSSMIRDDDCNVAPITRTDFIVGSGTSTTTADYFINFCSLTNIVTEICRNFFTLRAVSSLQNINEIAQKARPLQQSLLLWLESLPPSLRLEENTDDGADEVPESRGTLHIAYFTAHILIFRAMLRPIVRQYHTDAEGSVVDEALQGSRDFMKMLITVVRNLDLKYISAFWPGYTRHCFCYPGLFCYMLCFQKRSPQLSPGDRELLATWRNVLRARVASWPLLRFAIVKVDAIFWKKLNHTKKEGI